MTTPASGAVMLSATCKVCGGSWSMTDAHERVVAAYGVWDKEHKHSPPSDASTSSALPSSTGTKGES